MEKKLGTVLRFEPVRGWGFVRENGTTTDYFIHYNNIISKDKIKNVFPGDLVSFYSHRTSKGLEAFEIETIHAKEVGSG